MANIYRGGYINIAATAAEDGHGGIISPASDLPEPSVKRFYLSTSGGSKSIQGHELHDSSFMICKSLEHEIRRHLSGSNYRYFTRGWVLQELALSPRTIHFPHGQLLWQCRHCFTSEDGTFWSPDLLSLANGNLQPGSFNFSNLESSSSLWRQWIHSYSTRDLTFKTDVGPAIAGLISFYREKTNRTPVLGLWLETLPFDLCWDLHYRKPGRPPPLEPRDREFPSWSWLSVLPQQDAVFAMQAGCETNSTGLRIEHWAEEWAGQEFTSKLIKSHLTVSSFVRLATIRFRTPETWTSACACPVSVIGEPSWSGLCRLEYLFLEDVSQTFTILHLFQGNTGHSIIDYFLVLLSRSENPSLFYRVGQGDVQTALSRINVEAEGKTGHFDVHFSERDRQTVRLV